MILPDDLSIRIDAGPKWSAPGSRKCEPVQRRKRAMIDKEQNAIINPGPESASDERAL